MAEQVRELGAVKPHRLRSILRTYVVERVNQLKKLSFGHGQWHA